MARNFDGSTGYLSVAQAPVAAAPLTMACWFRKTGPASTARELMGISDASSLDYFVLGAGDGISAAIYAGLYDETQWDAAYASATFAADQWHHAAAVFVSDHERHVLLNGGHKGSGTATVSPTNLSAAGIGHLIIDVASSYFPGDIAEAAVWNVTLADEEIGVLAKGYSPLCLWHRLPNLVVYQDLIRPLNRPGVGLAAAAVGGTSVVEHPRMIYPHRYPLGGLQRMLFAAPYRLSAAAACGGCAAQGWAALAGAEQGATCPIGEVSS